MAGWLAPWALLESSALGPYSFCFPGWTLGVCGVYWLLQGTESRATEWGLTRDTLRAHFGPWTWAWLLLVLAGWLVGGPAGLAGAAGWVADWLAEWLAGCLLGLSWTFRLRDWLFLFFPGVGVSM